MKNGRNLPKTSGSAQNLIFLHFCILTIYRIPFTPFISFTPCTHITLHRLPFTLSLSPFTS